MNDTGLERALEILRTEGRSVGQVTCGQRGIQVMIDGQNLSRAEIFEITRTPDSIWPFQADGKECEVRIYFDPQGMVYEVRECHRRVGERQSARDTDYSERELSQRIIKEYTSS